MTLAPCPSCGKEVSKSAKSCPHCGHKLKGSFLKKLILWPIGILIGLAFLVAILGGGEKGNTVTKKGSNQSPKEAVFDVGDSFQTRKFEISVSDVKQLGSVGSKYFSSQPSEGAIYIAVQWNYKNISDKPINAFSTPSLKLIGASGTKYSADVGASSSYATELNLDSKVISDLNPGIRVRDADVFEVSQEAFDSGNWTLLIDADQSATVQLTLLDQTQNQPSLIQKTSNDDLNAIAAAESRVDTNDISGAMGQPEEQSTSDGADLTTDFPQSVDSDADDPTARAPSFDCEKASTSAERLICSNKELSAADVELAQAYLSARNASTDKSWLSKQQSTWRKTVRDACSDAQCMLSAYEQRIRELN